jgi:hypothetical protein
MKRAPAVVLLTVVIVTAAGCGASGRQRATIGPPADVPVQNFANRAAIRYQPEGVTLYAVPAGYRPAVSRSQVLALYRRWHAALELTARPSVRLWMVSDRERRPSKRDYPAWVLTFRHTKPVSYGPAATAQKADCAWVSIYDIRTRVWTENFQNCPGRPTPSSSCDSGCTPANQPALDAAASYAREVAGDAHCYTGTVVDDTANKVVVYLAHAPHSVLAKLRARHPGIYAIHNDAPRTMAAVLALQHDIDWAAWKAQGVDIVSTGPTQTGYLQVGVLTNVAKAQAAFDAKYGPGLVQAVKGELAIATAAVASGVPSLRTDLRLTRHYACLDASRHRVSRRTLRRFHAVTAVECTEGQRIYHGQGQWEVLVRKVAVGDVSGLQRYYQQPDEPNLPKRGICTANLIGLAIPVFVDAHGRWVVPRRWPRDKCGHPLGYGVGHGPPPVRWHVVRVRRIKQLITAPAVAAGCPMRWGNSVAWAGPPRDSSGGPLFTVAPKRVRVCVFRTPPDRFAVGRFVRGFRRLDAARTGRLLRALTGPGPRRGCPKQRTFAVVIAHPGSVASVELGGCWRVDRADRLAGTAKPAVVEAILGGG